MENKPWLPYLATEYIKHLAPKSVFEWGSGNSTLFWIDTIKCKQLVSIEHNLEWYQKIKPQIYQCGWVDYKYISSEEGEIGPDMGNPDHYKSGSTELGKVNFKKYASVIDDYYWFDLILIDGMARASCLKHAYNHIQPGGAIVLDNVDRSYYLEQQEEKLFGNWEYGWEKIEFFGYGPILDYKWKTAIFIKP